MAQRNITLRTGISVHEVTADHLVTDQGELPFDLCLWAGSFRGFPLGREAGLAVNELDQVRVDATLRSITDPNIYAMGDGAVLPAEFAPTLVMGCKTASPLGIHAAENVAADLKGEAVRPFWFRYLLTCVSIGRNVGLVQVLGGDGRPAQRFITGRLGAQIKEFVCHSTITAMYVERNLSLAAQWLSARAKRPEQPGSNQQPAQESTAAHGHRI